VILVDEAVVILGPDGVAVAITAEAAEQSGRVLIAAARRAAKNAGGGVRPVRLPKSRSAIAHAKKEDLTMSDDKSNRGEPDRSRVSGSEPYEVRYFADKHGLSMDQAEDLIRQHGSDRETLDRAAEQLRA
jgi:hypothetical protein